MMGSCCCEAHEACPHCPHHGSKKPHAYFSDRLKACPFCGGFNAGILEAGGVFWVKCACGATSGMFDEKTGDDPPYQQAHDAWNTRKPDTRRVRQTLQEALELLEEVG